MGSEGYGYHGRYQAKGGFYSSPEQQTRANRSNALALTPCSVSQLRRAVEGPNGFTCGGTDLNMVCVVGLVRAVSSPSVSCVIYLLDDMTGPPIQAKFWTEEGDVENCINPGAYVRVIGRIRSFESRRLVSGLHIRRLEDLNEITSHILEVVHAHMTYRPGPQPNAHMTYRPGHSQMNEAVAMSSDGGGQEAAGCQRRAGDPLGPSTGLSPMQDQVLLQIKSCADHQGLGLSALRCRFPPQNAASLWECLQFLISEGHIYTTTDDNHFKATYG